MDIPLPFKNRVLGVFSDLEGHSDLLSTCVLEWRQLQNFLMELEKSLLAKLEELNGREKEFLEKSEVAKQALDRRDGAISAQEEASLARVEEQKVAALAALEEEKRMYLRGEREMKDNASGLAMGSEASGKWNTKVSELPSDNQYSKLDAQSTPAGVSVSSDLKSLCASMDGDGLRQYIVDHHRKLHELRNKLPLVFRSVSDPARLVLNALDGFHLLGLDPLCPIESGATSNVRACMFLLQRLKEVYPIAPSGFKESAKNSADKWICKGDSSDEESEYRELKAQTFLHLLETFNIASEYEAAEVLKHVVLIANRKKMPVVCESLGLTEHMPGLVDKLYEDGKALECLSFAHHFGLMDRVKPGPLLNGHLRRLRREGKDLVQTANKPNVVRHGVLMEELVVIKQILKAVENYHLAGQYSTAKLHMRLTQLEGKKAKERVRAEMERNRREKLRKRAERLREKTAEEIEKELRRKQKKWLKNQVRRRKAIDAGKPKGKKTRVSGEFTKQLPPRPPADTGFYLHIDPDSATVPAHELSGHSKGYEQPSQANYTPYLAGSLSAGPVQNAYLHPTDIFSHSFYQSASAYSGPTATYDSYQYGNDLPAASVYQLSYPH